MRAGWRRVGDLARHGLIVTWLVALDPTAAWACMLDGSPANGTISAVLLETIEQVSVASNNVRHARAREAGTLSNGCGTLAVLGSTIKVQATSSVPMDPTARDLGVGPMAGSFQTDANQWGFLLGSLDFRPTNRSVTTCGGGPCPFVWVSGTWTVSYPYPLVGNFAGVALVPFRCGLGLGWCYLDPTGTVSPAFTEVPVLPEELNRQGVPEAKFIVTLYQ